MPKRILKYDILSDNKLLRIKRVDIDKHNPTHIQFIVEGIKYRFSLLAFKRAFFFMKEGHIIGIDQSTSKFISLSKKDEHWIVSHADIMKAKVDVDKDISVFIDLFTLPDDLSDSPVICNKNSIFSFIKLAKDIETSPLYLHAWLDILNDNDTFYSVIHCMIEHCSDMNQVEWIVGIATKIMTELCVAISKKPRTTLLKYSEDVIPLVSGRFVKSIDRITMSTRDGLEYIYDTGTIVKEGTTVVGLPNIIRLMMPSVYRKRLLEWSRTRFRRFPTVVLQNEYLALMHTLHQYIALSKRKGTIDRIKRISRASPRASPISRHSKFSDDSLVQLFQDEDKRKMFPPCLLSVDDRFKTGTINHLNNIDRMAIVGVLKHLGQKEASISAWLHQKFVNQGDVTEERWNKEYRNTAKSVISGIEKKGKLYGKMCWSMKPSTNEAFEDRNFICPFYEEEFENASCGKTTEIEDLHRLIKRRKLRSSQACHSHLKKITKFTSSEKMNDYGTIFEPAEYTDLYLKNT